MNLDTSKTPENCPIQAHGSSCLRATREGAFISKEIHLRAYEVYCKVYGEQQALIEGWCRGGFGLGELVAFLYAHSFPENEWKQRVDEAFKGCTNL